jgi:Type IV secretion system pilin
MNFISKKKNYFFKLFLFILTTCSLMINSVSPIFAAERCEWAKLNNVTSEYHGRMSYCVGGFDTRDDLLNAEVNFRCVENCGTPLSIFSQGQTFEIRDVPGGNYGQDGDGKWFTCLIPLGLDDSVSKTVNECISPNLVKAGLLCAATGVGVAGLTTLTLGTTAVANAGILLTACSTAAIAAIPPKDLSDQIKKCYPEFQVTVKDESTLVCTNGFDFKFVLEDLDLDLATFEPFGLCKQIADPDQKAKCEECSGEEPATGVWTAIGCIPTKPESVVQTFIKIGLTIGGGVALLMILVGGFMLSVSQGDPKKTQDAKERITSSIIGLIFIIFSITILQFIGVQIFRIPGFGT